MDHLGKISFLYVNVSLILKENDGIISSEIYLEYRTVSFLRLSSNKANDIRNKGYS